MTKKPLNTGTSKKLMFKVLGCKPNITSKCILECSLAAEDTSTKTDNGEDSLNTCPAISIALFCLLVPHYQEPGIIINNNFINLYCANINPENFHLRITLLNKILKS